MIERYTRPEMAAIWSEESRLQRWLEVELTLVDVLAERGEVPVEAARALRRNARVDPARMRAIEAEVKHDVVAFQPMSGGEMHECPVGERQHQQREQEPTAAEPPA